MRRMDSSRSVEPNDLLLFARVVEEGSFSRAGERLQIPKSTVSRRLAVLERSLGERLLLRTTRKLTVTDFGHSVLEHAQHVATEVEAASSLAQHRQAEPSGRLRVSMPNDFANDVMSPLLAAFLARHPAITLELDLSPRRVDLIGENFDLAIRIGELIDDSSLTARRLASFPAGLYAAPVYIARRGMPQHPSELMQHDALHLQPGRGEPKRWAMTRGDESWSGLPSARAAGNSPELLIRLARQGVGIALVTEHFAEPFERNGELVAVLPDWTMPAPPVWAVFPGRRLMPARTRVFLDAMQAEFSGARCQVVDEQHRATRSRRAAARS